MGLVFRLPLRALRQPENGLCFVVSIRLALTMRLVPTGHLLFFASPKKSEQKKGDCGCRFTSQTSLVSHDFSGGQKTRRFAAQTVLSFFSEKSRSTRLRQQERCFVVNVLDGI